MNPRSNRSCVQARRPARRLAFPQLISIVLILVLQYGCSNRTNAGKLMAPARNASRDANPLAFYVSASKGSDMNAGTEELPFKTLAKGVSALAPGCTLYVMEGTYHETLSPPSGTHSKPVRVTAYRGQTPVISGANPLQDSWRHYKGQIYQTAFTGKAFNQLFVDGKMMTTARWPKAASDPDSVLDMQRAMTSAGNERSISDPSLPAGDWAGGKICIWPGAGWVSFSRTIKDYTPGEGLSVTENFPLGDPHATDNPYSPRKGNYYFLFGKLAGLELPNEWVLERTNLYLCAPDGKNPEQHLVEYRVRDFGIYLKDKSHVEVSGLALFAAAITMENASNCVINGCNQKYHEHFDDFNGYGATSAHHLNYVSGRNNVWENGSIAYAAGDGIRLDGRDNVITNMLIHDIDYCGAWFAGVMGQPGSNKDGVPDAGNTEPTIVASCNDALVTHCTIYNCGRNAILHHKTGKFDILYNDLSHASKLVKDCGLTSTFGTDGKGSVIAYNWLHDNVGDYAVGIYLDCFNRNFVIHNNVIWNCSWAGIQLNGYSRSNLVYNNTIWDCGAAFATYSYPGDTPDQGGTRIFNNLYDGKANFVTGPWAPWLAGNVKATVKTVMDARYVPKRDGPAIGAGTVVAGVDNPFSGPAPDAGAYQHGGVYWTPGRGH